MYSENTTIEDGEMAEQLRALILLPGELGSNPSTHTEAHNYLLISRSDTLMQTYVQTKATVHIKFKEKKETTMMTTTTTTTSQVLGLPGCTPAPS